MYIIKQINIIIVCYHCCCYDN